MKPMIRTAARWIARASVFLLLAVALAQSRPAGGTWVEAHGVRARVPDGWYYNDRLAAASGPLNLTNFAGPYAAGGLLPPDGAEIEITSLPAPPDLMDYIKRELKPAKVDRIKEMSAGEKSGIQAIYLMSFPAGASLKTSAAYIPHGGTLYKFYLSYWAGNRNEAAILAAFDRVVKEAQLR